MPFHDVLLGLLVAVMWGTNSTVMKVGVSELPPLLLAGLRFALSVVPLVFLLPRPAISWGLLWAFAVAFGIVKFTALFLGLRLGMPAGLTAIVLQLQAGFTVVLAALLLGEPVGGAQRTGLALALAGLAVLALEWATSAPLIPFALVVAAAAAWAVANIVTKRAGAIDPLAFAVWTSLLAAGPLLALALVADGPAAIRAALTDVTWRGIGAVLYLAYPVNVLGLAVWSGLLGRHPAAAVAPFALLVPVFGLLGGHIVLGEPFTRTLAAGSGLILLGLAITIGAGRTRAQPTA
jgi:O-acetylserine/cysteine efflux transporter